MRKRFSLRLQVLLLLLLFSTAVLGLIYLAQTVFLDDFYRESKTAILKATAHSISENISDPKLDDYLLSLSYSNEVCARIITSDPLQSAKLSGACILERLDQETINEIARETERNNGKKLFEDYVFLASPFESKQLVIYAELIRINNNPLLILVSSLVTPLGATISTIRSQYKTIVLIVLALTVLLALLLSSLLLKPIRTISGEARKLPEGTYSGDQVKENSREVRELNETLKSANSEILKAEKARKELLGNVSHDLRTPLTMIVGYGEMIRDIESENTAENINTIIEEAKRLSLLVDDLLDLSQGGKIPLKKQELSAKEVLQAIYHQYRKYADQLGVEFRLHIEEDCTFSADEKRLYQIIYNFLNNAFHYNSKAEKIIELGISGRRFYVYDNGDGIREADRSLIFDRYYKVDKEHVRSTIGSGIGLSLAKDLLEAHGFKYGVESEEGVYSRFWFEV